MKQITLWIVLVLLQGCATGTIHIENEDVPIDDQHSLVIGAKVGSITNVYIDDKRYRIESGTRFRGTLPFAIELPPGDHTLNTITMDGGDYYYRYPIDRKFTTRPGGILNLGTIITRHKPSNKEFVYGWIANHKDTAKVLSQEAPAWLANDLENHNYAIASGPYLGEKGLKQILLPRIVPSFNVIMPQNVPRGASFSFHGDILGTIGIYASFQKRGETETDLVHIVFTDNTNYYYESCTGSTSRLLCVASDTALLDRDGFPKDGESTRNLVWVDAASGTTFNVKTLPFNTAARSLFWSSDLIVVVDEEFDVYSSIDNGDTWQSMPSGVERQFMELRLRGVKFEAKKDQILVHLSGANSGEVRVDSDTGEIKKI
ncbi:hypothetical protein EB809_17125 [Marinobacter sp. R17]|uniref:hypothetical protein n=1 Tax=Marinobacter sp. R17 TaxID=2484250 RepID=UPI000F4B7889|nr:hypothetical protein [Marinobacter sp. R17]ROT96147.1 hypothetical protein EB809_17125 [Marinobacter sp. R17]